jgi:hypothetical protein
MRYPVPRLSIDLALDVTLGGSADGVLERDVEELALVHDGLALRQVGDREPDATPGSLCGGV